MSKFNIGPISKRAPHLLADLLELMLYYSGDFTEISKSDLESINNRGECDPDEIGEIAKQSAEAHDSTWKWIEDCFVQLEYRESAFADSYPFVIEDGVLRRRGKIDNNTCLYLFLLCCSRLRSFSKKIQQYMASHFEVISRDALKMMLPDSGDVKIFGANSEDRKKHYGTNLREALRILAKDLKEDFIEKNIDEEDTSGDCGLDIVGRITFKDPAPSLIAVFGQCAARETEWPKKTFESHPARFSKWIAFTHDPINMVFIPLCYRQATGQWVKQSPTSRAILIDRLRICDLLKDRPLPDKVRHIFREGELAVS